MIPLKIEDIPEYAAIPLDGEERQAIADLMNELYAVHGIEGSPRVMSQATQLVVLTGLIHTWGVARILREHLAKEEEQANPDATVDED